MLKKSICISLVVLSLLLSLRNAADAGTVDLFMRSSKHEGFTRVVFESVDESFIKGSNVTQAQNQIKIKFPSRFSLVLQGKSVVETSANDSTLMVNFNAPFKIKVMYLYSPPRLSIDITSGEAPEPKAQKPEAVKTESPQNLRIVIDAGHGGYDAGIVSDNAREKDIALSLARELESALIKKNRPVYLTRRSDQFVSIRDRMSFANQKAPDLFLSLHMSSSDSFVIYTSVRVESGSETHLTEEYDIRSSQRRFVGKSISLANDLGGVIKDEFNAEVLIRSLPLPLLDSVNAPAVMLEVPKSVLQDSETKTRLSETLLKGIAAHAGR